MGNCLFDDSGSRYPAEYFLGKNNKFVLEPEHLVNIPVAVSCSQFIPFVNTIAAILPADLLKGIIVGIIVGLYFVMRINYKSAMFVE